MPLLSWTTVVLSSCCSILEHKLHSILSAGFVIRTPSHSACSRTFCTHFILVHMRRMAQGVARRVFINERSDTCHHVSGRALTLFALTSSSLSLSSVSTTCPCSSSPLSWASSSMWSIPPSTKSTAHPQNEEYCPVAIHKPSHMFCTVLLTDDANWDRM